MAENLLNLVKDIIYRFKPQQTPNSIHTKKTTSRHFTTTLLKSRDKERIFKAARQNNMLHMGDIYQKYCWQPTKDNEGQKAVKQHCKNAERKKKNTTGSGTKTLPEWQQSGPVLQEAPSEVLWTEEKW